MAWDPTLPVATGTNVKDSEAGINANFAYLETQLEVGMGFLSGTGLLAVQAGNKAARDAVATPPEGMPFLRTDVSPGAVDMYESAAWVRRVGPQVGDFCFWSGDPADLATDMVGWAICDGDTENGFVTPDLRGKMIAGYEAGGDVDGDHDYSAGWDTGGEKDTVLAENEMPAHYHGGGDHEHDYTKWDVFDSTDQLDSASPNFGYSSQDTGLPNSTVADSEGGGLKHSNLPPYYALAILVFVDVA